MSRQGVTIQTIETKHPPKLAIIMGDAAGIGPEIVAKSLNTEETRRICIPAVIGDARVMAEAVRLTGVPLKIVIRRSWAEVTGDAGLMEIFDLANLDPGEYKMGEVCARAGKACLEYLDFARPLYELPYAWPWDRNKFLVISIYCVRH